MAKKTKVFNLEKTVLELLEEYGEEIGKDVVKGVETVAPEVVSKVQQSSPKDSGEYAKGWTMNKVTTDRGKTTVTIYQKDKPTLTHLLENGHAKRGGGRTKAKKHIKPVQKWAEDALYEEVVKNIND